MNFADTASLPQVYDLVLCCGNIHSPRNFAIELVTQVRSLVPYDHARIYFVNENKRIHDQYLLGIDPKWVNAYMEYYSKIEDGRYDIFGRISQQKWDPNDFMFGTVNWIHFPSSEFIRDYIKPIGIKYSLGFNLCDIDGNARALFMLDRCSLPDFTDSELGILRMALPLLNHLYQNFFAYQTNLQSPQKIDWHSTQLTRREIEIATLLCHGLSPSTIAEKLHIASSTAYKHIAHIYKKMQVTSQQELLVKLLNKG